MLLAAISCTGSLARKAILDKSSGLAEAGLSRQEVLEQSWLQELGNSEADKKRNPIKKVVSLLNKMLQELDAEAKAESEMYDKLMCWCFTTRKQKNEAIDNGRASTIDLRSDIESRSARFGEISTTIKILEHQIAEDTEALDKANSIRTKESAEFGKEEKEMVQVVSNLKNAIIVLKRHTSASFLQLDGPLLSGLRVVLRDAALKYELLQVQGRAPATKRVSFLDTNHSKNWVEEGASAMLLNALDVHGSSVPEAIPQDLAASLVAKSATSNEVSFGTFLQAKDRQPRSGAEILGILQGFLMDFKNSLAQARSSEQSMRDRHEELAGAKKEQLSIAKTKLDNLQVEQAANQKALADAKEDLGITAENLSNDVELMHNLKKTCGEAETQWEHRADTRGEEMKTITETIAILASEEAPQGVAPTLFQLDGASAGSASVQVRRKRAAEILQHAARAPEFQTDDLLAAWHSRQQTPIIGAGPRTQLGTLAVSVQLDSFGKVKEMMDMMIQQLNKQQQEEVKFREYCDKKLSDNEKMTYVTSQEKQDLETEQAQLNDQIEKLGAEIADEKTQIADAEVDIKTASANREKENAEYQDTLSSQTATQAVLKKAIERLKAFYKTKAEASAPVALLQNKNSQEPPVKFAKYQKNKMANGVIAFLEMIVRDSQKLVAQAQSGEEKAQEDYQMFVKESNSIVSELSEAITKRTKSIAAVKLDVAEVTSELGSASEELEDFRLYERDLHAQCDFVLKNFSIRQKARMQEVDAIQQAKSILSGAGAAAA